MKLTLAKKAMLLWRLWLGLGCAVVGLLFSKLLPVLGKGWVAAGIFAAAVALWGFFFWIPGFYSSYRIRMEGNRIHVSRGVFWKGRTAPPSPASSFCSCIKPRCNGCWGLRWLRCACPVPGCACPPCPIMTPRS